MDFSSFLIGLGSGVVTYAMVLSLIGALVNRAPLDTEIWEKRWEVSRGDIVEGLRETLGVDAEASEKR